VAKASDLPREPANSPHSLRVSGLQFSSAGAAFKALSGVDAESEVQCVMCEDVYVWIAPIAGKPFPATMPWASRPSTYSSCARFRSRCSMVCSSDSRPLAKAARQGLRDHQSDRCVDRWSGHRSIPLKRSLSPSDPGPRPLIPSSIHRRVRTMGIRDHPTAPHSPRLNSLRMSRPSGGVRRGGLDSPLEELCHVLQFESALT